MSEASAVDVGSDLGQFTLVKVIGSGDMGIVYRGFDTQGDRYVAIKVLAPSLAKEPGVAERFVREAQAAASLHHANVVEVYSASEQGDAVYYVMELVEGHDLETILQNRAPLPVEEATNLIRQVALGLQHAHEKGITHGDVKPFNVLVNGNGEVKVVDFGMMQRVRGGGDDARTVFATVGYVSPEIVVGMPFDHRSDIYSLGAMYFRALAGVEPFAGGSDEEVLRRQTHEEAPSLGLFNERVPLATVQIVARMLAREPLDRFQTYAELVHALNKPIGAPVSRPILPSVEPVPVPTVAYKVAPQPVPEGGKSGLGRVLASVVVGASLLLIVLVLKGKQWFGSPTPDVIISQPVRDLEAEAQKKFEGFKRVAEDALVGGHWSEALAVYRKWPAAEYNGTRAQQALTAEQDRIIQSAQEEWTKAVAQIDSMRKAGQWPEALAVVDKFLHECEAIPSILENMQSVRQQLAAGLLAQNEEKLAAEQAKRARVEQLRKRIDECIVHFDWDKGQRELQGDPAGGDGELGALATRLHCLIVLRNNIQGRLKVAPSPMLALATKSGEVQAQVFRLDASSVTLRRTLGKAGYAETRLNWNEITLPSLARIFVATLDANKPEELYGYAIFLSYAARSGQVRVEDARKALQAVAVRVPAYATAATASLNELSELETVQKAAAATAATTAAARQAEVDAAALWQKLQLAVGQRQREQAEALKGKLVSEFVGTEFVKGHMGEIDKLMASLDAGPVAPPPVSTVLPRATPGTLATQGSFLPLDISAACNGTCFDGPGAQERGAGFRLRRLYEGIAEHLRVPIPETQPRGEFVLQPPKDKDSILISGTIKRLPPAVTIALPSAQQRQYSRLAILSASGIDGATVKVEFKYETGEPTEANLAIVSWAEKEVPSTVHVALDLPKTPHPSVAARMFSNLVDLDPRRRLKAVTFTWLSTDSTIPTQHAVGIFALSGLPAGMTR